MEGFGDWLLLQLEDRGWSQSELARRAGLGNATLSRIISGTRKLGPETAISIAEALGESPAKVFRLAGLLPPINESRRREFEEISEMLASLPDPIRKQTMIAVRALARDAYERALKEEEEKQRK